MLRNWYPESVRRSCRISNPVTAHRTVPTRRLHSNRSPPDAPNVVDNVINPIPNISPRMLTHQDREVLSGLRFTPGRPVLGRYTGHHTSPLRGRSGEFADYRRYMPGDDAGTIDWKVYGRSNRLYIKRHEHESDMTVRVVVDASASMAYAGTDETPQTTTAVSKFDHAAKLAASIAFVVAHQRDGVGVTLAHESLHMGTEPATHPRGLLTIDRLLTDARPNGRAELAKTLSSLAHRTHRRGLLVVCSDLHEPMPPILKSLDLFLHHGHEAIVFHVLHRDELRLPDIGEALFIDSESGRALHADASSLRQAYEARVQQWIDGWATALRSRGVAHHMAPIDVPCRVTLSNYLFTREGEHR